MRLFGYKDVYLVSGILSLMSCTWGVIPHKADSSKNCSATNGAYDWLVSDDFESYPMSSCGAGVICGHFNYQKRLVNVNGQALTDSTCAPPFPVQYALVELYDSSGTTLMDSTSTDDNGDWSFSSVPTGTTFRVKLVSKTKSSDALHTIDVRDRTGSETNYSVTIRNVYRGQRVNYTIPIEDSSSGSIMAGAFNILSVYTRAQHHIVQTFGSVFSNKLIAYWESGSFQETHFSDNITVGGDVKIFITGGIAGSQKLTDTDEFDDSVILHEFGHYADYSFSSYDTPGGSHLDFAIDPRLAWAEGWADFFSIYMTSTGPDDPSPHYVDTFGIGDESAVYFELNPETNRDSIQVKATNTSGIAVTKTVGVNGEQYQLSVTEYLWDLYDTTDDDVGADTGSVPIAAMWRAFNLMKTDRSDLDARLDAPAGSDGRFQGMDTVGKFSQILKKTYTAYASLINAMESEEGHTLEGTDFGGNYLYWPPPITPTTSAVSQVTNYGAAADVVSICATSTYIFNAALPFCWITGRQLLDMPGILYSSPSAHWATSYLSKRWIRIKPSSSTTYTFYLKSGCLPDTSYQSFTCMDPDASGGDASSNNYDSILNDLNMALWVAPQNNELSRVGVTSSLFMGSSSGTGAAGSDDDDFDGNPTDSSETGDSGNYTSGTDVIDDNQGSQSMEIALDSSRTYFLEVYATTANNSAAQQMEGRFRVWVCAGDAVTCRSYYLAATGMGGANELVDW